jgi:uroporphyrinogen decarboxylase
VVGRHGEGLELMMTERERFLRFMRGQTVDRAPLMDMGFWPETFERWYHEGLPAWVTTDRHLEDYLRLDQSFNRHWLPIELRVFPTFEVEVLEETEAEWTIRDESGVVLRQQKRNKTIPQYIRFPVENEADYEAMWSRLDGKNPARYPADFDEDLHWRAWRGEIIGVNFPGFFGFPRILMGLENYCMAFYDQPQLVRRMIADRVQFAKDALSRLLATGMLDFVQVWEDMAFKTAPLISPRLVRQFMLPAYEDLIDFLRKGGAKLIMVDCDGRVNDLLPIYRAAGMDGVHPCEVAAGADPIELRRLWPGCALMGGMDKRLIASGRDGVDAELDRLRPVLQQGAFIPFLDHFVPPDVSYDTYRYYLERRRDLLGGPPARTF